MIQSRYSRNVVAAGLLVLFAAALPGQTEDTLSGRNLLNAMRNKDGQGPKPAYENRSRQTSGLLKETAGDARDQLLQIIPAESLFCLRVNNFDYTLSQIDQFLAGVSPLPMGVSMLARTQLAKLLGSPQLNGVNTGRAFAVFGTTAGGQSAQTGAIPGIFIAALLPVTDYERFIAGNPNCAEPDAQGISKITAEGTPAMLAAQLGNFALIGSESDYDAVAALAKSDPAPSNGLSSALAETEAKRATEQPIWLYGNVCQLSDAFGPLLLAKMEQMKAMIETIKASGQGPMADPSVIIGMYTEILEKLMKETQSLSISVSPKPEVLNITETISAMPGTEMADMFTADAPVKQDNKLLGYLEDGAVMNASGGITGKLNARITSFFATILCGGRSPETMARIKSLASDFADVFSGTDAMSFSIDPKSKPPFAGKYVSEIMDKDKLTNLIQEGAELFNTGGIADFYKELGFKTAFTLKRGVDTYKGVSIDSARLTMEPADPNSPEGLVMNMIYGGGFDYRWGTVDNLWVCAVGGNVDLVIRKLIDQVKAGGTKQVPSEFEAAMALLPEADKADFVVTYNFPRLFGMMGAIMPVPMPQMDIPTKSNLALAGYVGGGSMTVDIALPKEHLTEIMALFQMMVQQMQNTGIPEHFAHEMTWVKCRNPKCRAEYEITKKEYYEYLEKNTTATMMTVPALICTRCGELSVYRAIKCEKCGLVFEASWKRGDFEDRCPKCGYSKIEDERKRAANMRRKLG
ncbi:MAG TPA: hypothetical protein VMW16_09165 [Sedimentisphaerales bacterium]|nr:hypothetical protein [Sedimentisphaerales bacterium]